jgi:pyridoxamine 5'-phosphate oxidase
MLNIASIRKDYKLRSLSELDVASDPLTQFERWWEEAVKSDIDEVNAMTLATASSDGLPSARIVLLKGFDATGFSFYTNYNSFKGRQLEENPRCCLVFFWKELERQVRVTGLVAKVTPEQSTAYFNSRPRGSRIGALASPQSEVIAGREWLEANQQKVEQQLGDEEPVRPEHWGGYVVKPVTVEFWQGRSSRLHDRIQYSLAADGNWKVERLAP